MTAELPQRMTEKERLKQAYIQGVKDGKNVEEVSDVAIRAAEARFERWYDRQYE
jgi:hypothetical protein